MVCDQLNSQLKELKTQKFFAKLPDVIVTLLSACVS